LVLGFLIFIFDSKHPDGVGVCGHLHTNKKCLRKTVQNRTAYALDTVCDVIVTVSDNLNRNRTEISQLCEIGLHDFLVNVRMDAC